MEEGWDWRGMARRGTVRNGRQERNGREERNGRAERKGEKGAARDEGKEERNGSQEIRGKEKYLLSLTTLIQTTQPAPTHSINHTQSNSTLHLTHWCKYHNTSLPTVSPHTNLVPCASPLLALQDTNTLSLSSPHPARTSRNMDLEPPGTRHGCVSESCSERRIDAQSSMWCVCVYVCVCWCVFVCEG